MIIDGKALALDNKMKLKDKVIKSTLQYKRSPKLVVVLVGNNPASLSYIKGKQKGCEFVGIDFELINFNEEITTVELIECINKLNNDENVDGILVQLPLPKSIDSSLVIDSISVFKDVDGFTPVSTGLLWQKRKCLIPCTANGIIKLLKSEKIEVAGKNVCVIGRSNIVGLPVSKLLTDMNATVRVLHSKVENLSEYTKQADILIVAIGQSKFIKASMVKQGAVVIDVGINKDESGKLCGDVDFDDVNEKSSYITKVPGGVGPMTIACLLENTYEAYLERMNVRKGNIIR